MLILTRRIAETINIGDDITVTVLGIKGNQVRLGVEAPRDVPVHREEIYEKIKVRKALEAELASCICTRGGATVPECPYHNPPTA